MSEPSKIALPDIAELREDFALAYRQSAEGAVARLVCQTKQRADGDRVSALVMLPHLIGAGYAKQNLFLDAVLQASSPRGVLHAAADLYREHKDERLLELACSLLEHFSSGAAASLVEFLRKNLSLARPFVRAIAHLPFPSERARIEALLLVADSDDEEVRLFAKEVAEAISPRAERAVRQRLEDDRDDRVRQATENRSGNGEG